MPWDTYQPVLLRGDCLALLPTLAENSIDACVTDPPYHLTTGKNGGSGIASLNENSPAGRARISTGFMGKAWDGGDVAFRLEVWREVLRVLKPGGYLLAFGGTRTYHRLACAVEDAGFEIRDCVQWLYGSGFPKSLNVGNGRGTALKPACELIVMARKPLSEPTVAANVLRWGTGAINIDGCRVGTDETIKATRNIALGSSSGGVYGSANVPGVYEQHAEGRWPANVVTDGSDEVVGMFPTAPGQLANAKQFGTKTVNVYGKMNREGETSANKRYVDEGATNFAALPGQRRNDTGSAVRFFYQAKASKHDRADSKHPTVKPITLIRYLARLVTPPNGKILDPFAGSGTTGAAAFLEDFDSVLIERELEYQTDIQRRIMGLSK
jgi:site-specific DNA-methyltransferase (adenine-specific)